MAPAVITLFLWMIVPLVMTLYFSVVHYNLMQPGIKEFIGLANFEFFVTDPDFGPAILNTLKLLSAVIAITVVLGVALALLVNEPFPGRGVVRKAGRRCRLADAARGSPRRERRRSDRTPRRARAPPSGRA